MLQQIHTVDIVLPRRIGNFPRLSDSYEIPLVRRKRGAFEGYLALPGGKLDDTDDDVEEAAAREMKEEVGLDIDPEYFRQVLTFARLGRDPRPGRWISTLFLCVSTEVDFFQASGAQDPHECSVEWVSVEQARQTRLAFDHNDLLEVAWVKFVDIPTSLRQ